MRILVTGGAGFIGSHIVDAYIKQGHIVTVVDNLSTGHRDNLNQGVDFYQVDIRDKESLQQVFTKAHPEIVSHHAAQVNVRRSVDDPTFDALVNVIGSINVMECARTVGARKVIYSSSGGTVYGEPDTVPCLESHPIQPICPYGTSKYFVEYYLNLYQKHFGLNYTILRYGNVFGPRQDPNGGVGVVAIFAQLMLRGKPPVIYGSGDQVRDYVYIDDCVHANILVLNTGDRQVFNIGTGVPISVNQIFNALKPLTKFDGDPIYGPPKQGDIFRTYLDIELAQQELSWQPTVNFIEGLTRTVHAIKKSQSI